MVQVSGVWLTAFAIVTFQGAPVLAQSGSSPAPLPGGAVPADVDVPRPNAFGVLPEQSWVDGADFEGLTSGADLVGSAGWWRSPVSSTHEFRAAVTLPAGAWVDALQCLFYDNVLPNATVSLLKDGFDLRTRSPLPGLGLGVVTTTGTTGYQSPAVRIGARFTPLAGDVLNTYSLYFVTSDANLLFRGCRLLWHREVSPPPPTATFTDVPTSHPFFAYVEALKAAGITGGCGPGIYCPDAPVTRGQMAVFIARTLGLYWPY